MRKHFEKQLATVGTCAQVTLIDAMCEWWMAADRDDAFNQIKANSGVDLAGISNSVISGLEKAAQLLDIDSFELVSENSLEMLVKLTAEQIVLMLDEIHIQWIEDNFNAKRWAQKYFKGQLFQYRKTSRIPFGELEKDLLFVDRYLSAGYNRVTRREIQQVFQQYATADQGEEDLIAIAEKARTFAPEIIHWIEVYRDSLNPEKKAKEIEVINQFLAVHSDPEEIMEIMISAVAQQ